MKCKGITSGMTTCNPFFCTGSVRSDYKITSFSVYTYGLFREKLHREIGHFLVKPFLHWYYCNRAIYMNIITLEFVKMMILV